MNDKPEKVEITFGEALRRIAQAPKEVVDKQLVNSPKRLYNGGKSKTNPPPSVKKKS